MKKKNQFIEILRFIFCMMIVFHHSGFFVSSPETNFPFKSAGFFAVEFFFLLSGALAFKNIRSRSEDSAPMKYSVSYTISKLKRVFPYAALGIVLSYIWFFLSCDPSMSLRDRLFGRWNILYELFFLPMSGVMNVGLESYLNTPLWYLSVLLIALPLVLWLMARFKDSFENYFSIIIPLLLHAYLINQYGSIGNWGTYTSFAYSGVIRGFADLMLGCFVFLLSQKIAECTKIKNWMLTIAEIAIYAFSVYTFSTNVDGYTYEFAILLMALGLSISLSGRSATANIKGYVFGHLGELSLPIYCLHWPVYRLVTLYFPNIDYSTGVIVVIATCVALSEIMMIFIKGLKALKSNAQ